MKLSPLTNDIKAKLGMVHRGSDVCVADGAFVNQFGLTGSVGLTYTTKKRTKQSMIGLLRSFRQVAYRLKHC